MPKKIDANFFSNRPSLNKTEILLVILYDDINIPIKPKVIRDKGKSFGFPEIDKWNVSPILSGQNKFVVNSKEGWLLSSDGRRKVKEIIETAAYDDAKVNISANLRSYLPKITNSNTVVFLEEAIECYERNLLRSAVVLSWVGAIALLQDHVIKHHLKNFNSEAKRRNNKWKMAKTSDDLSKMKEHNFLEVLEALSIIGNNLKQELQNNCLKLRNSSGHPNSFKFGENRVASHLEILILNVFSKF